MDNDARSLHLFLPPDFSLPTRSRILGLVEHEQPGDVVVIASDVTARSRVRRVTSVLTSADQAPPGFPDPHDVGDGGPAATFRRVLDGCVRHLREGGAHLDRIRVREACPWPGPCATTVVLPQLHPLLQVRADGTVRASVTTVPDGSAGLGGDARADAERTILVDTQRSVLAQVCASVRTEREVGSRGEDRSTTAGIAVGPTSPTALFTRLAPLLGGGLPLLLLRGPAGGYEAFVAPTCLRGSGGTWTRESFLTVLADDSAEDRWRARGAAVPAAWLEGAR
ncbi:hypothetical protein ACFFKU_04170 [Kineococcus gynurae]|uniref:Uncharacterized protein n=1 Tax=Kineococcus gynurae TaxID=452979 RepID=A0ABV5LRJ3_9ACTN